MSDVDELRGPHAHRARRGPAAACSRSWRQFLRAETTLDYFADAIGTRTNLPNGGVATAPATRSRIAAWRRSWTRQANSTPVGADLHLQRAWSVDSQGGPAAVGRRKIRSPVAAVKITRHNLLRPHRHG